MNEGKKVKFFTINKNKVLKACEYVFPKDKPLKAIKEFLANEVFDKESEEKFYLMR